MVEQLATVVAVSLAIVIGVVVGTVAYRRTRREPPEVDESPRALAERQQELFMSSAEISKRLEKEGVFVNSKIEPRTGFDVIIVGAGVVGASVFYYLVKAGLNVCLKEWHRPAYGASGRTGGLVSPISQAPLDKPWLELGLRSLDLLVELNAELKGEFGDVFHRCGILNLAQESSLESLKDEYALQATIDRDVEWLEGDEILEHLPKANPAVVGGTYSPQEGYIEGRRYVNALVGAAMSQGGQLVQGERITQLETTGNKVIGVQTRANTYYADHVVLAAGPWSQDLWPEVEMPITPLKGQLLEVRVPQEFRPRSAVTWKFGKDELHENPDSLIPQVNGNILVAATKEPVFNDAITFEATLELRHLVRLVLPELEDKDIEIIGERAGVRAAGHDGHPLIGPHPNWEGLVIATGHKTGGMTLSAGTGKSVADFITTGKVDPVIEPFRLDRFND